MKRREFIKYAVMVPVAVTLSPHDWGLDDVKLDQTDSVSLEWVVVGGNLYFLNSAAAYEPVPGDFSVSWDSAGHFTLS